MSLPLKYLDVMEVSGFSDLPQKKPKIGIRHILNRVQPILWQRMANVIKWEMDGKTDTNSLTFDGFVISIVKHGNNMED